jgi:hypothetical protein
MAVDRRRLPARFILAFLLIGPALSLRAMDAQAAAGALTINAHVGYTDVVKAQQWMPISIAVTNSGPNVEGTLAIQSLLPGRGGLGLPASYERPFVLAAGSTKYFRTYLIPDAGLTVSVQVVRNGQILARQDISLTRTASTLIGVLSDDSTALDDLAGIHPGSVSATVVHLGLTDIDSAIALRAFDVLAVDDIATDGLTAGQQSAIADYVRSGGTLLVGTGASWRRTVAGLPAELLPLRATGLNTLASSPALGGVSGIQVATASLTGGTTWLAEGDQALLAERTVGSGSVIMATFDWKQDPISSWSGTKPLLRQVLVWTMFGPQAQQGAGQSMGGPFGGPGGSVYQRSNSLTPVLGNLPALDLPSLVLTGLLVLVYVLLVGPVNYFVLGALRRRSLGWITLPLIAVLVAGGAYAGGIWGKGQSVQTNEVSIVHVDPGATIAYQETYIGVLTPTRGDYEVSIGRRPALVSPISSYNGYGGSSRADIRVNMEDGKVVLPGMTAFTLRGFATESLVTAPQLTGHLREVNGQLVGSVDNRSATSFADALVIAGDGFQRLGPLAPGGSVAVGFAPRVATFNGPPAIYTIYSNNSFGPPPSQPSETQRDGQAKTQILSMLQSGGFKGLPSSLVPMVVAWTSQSFQDVTVNGVHPRANARTAVALTLPIDEVGAGRLPVGVVGGRVVDFEGTTQPGPPGAVMVQDGTVTLQFAPRLATGLHLTGASLSSSTSFMGKAGMGPGGVAPSVKGAAWDWSRSAWMDIGYQENAITALPAEAINPATGEVRLKITVANAQFMTSGISLAGTVE